MSGNGRIEDRGSRIESEKADRYSAINSIPQASILSPRSSSPRVVFFNRSYWPDTEATGQLLTELCEDLAPEFDVSVVAGRPNTSFVDERTQSQVRRRNSVTIERCRHTRFPKRSWLGRAVNWVTFLCTSLLAGMRLRRPHVIVVETDPPLLCLIGAFLKRWHRCKLVVYLQDIYPDVAVALGGLPDGRFADMLRSLFFGAYRQADRVVVLSRDMRDYLVRWGFSPQKISIVPNWIDATLVQPVKDDNAFRRDQDLGGKFVVMYSGNLGLSQRLDSVINAAEKLKHRNDIQFLLIGDGASKPRLEALVRERSIGNVRFLGYQPKERLAESLSAADLHLITMHPNVLSYLMPSKLYGILASGTASIATAPSHTELAEIIEQHRVGFVTRPDDADQLAERIAWAADHRGALEQMGERAFQLAQTEFDRPIATGRFAAILGQLVRGKKRREREGSRREGRGERIESIHDPSITSRSRTLQNGGT
jgi:colanic acid biosynthesis glycosyl transferase WcaI